MPFDSSPQHSRAGEIAIVGRMQELLATPDRWCKGATRYWPNPADPPAYCLMGALNVADNKRHSGLDSLSPQGISVASCLRAELPVAHPGNWNDAPGRTHAEVLGLLARVRRKLEEVA